MPAVKILIDICHPAHVHFFRVPMQALKERGHDLLVTSRVKEVATLLLDSVGISHRTLSVQTGGSIIRFGHELIQRNWRLYQVAREFRPDVMTAIGGIFIAHVGRLRRIPSLVFYDTENARLQNALTYPLVHRLYVPRCYRGWTPKGRTIRYAGYHELSYLHPKYFVPNREIAVANGLAERQATFLVRTVSWGANHDIGEHGWSAALLRYLVERLQALGHVLISSEGDLPAELAEHRYRGDPQSIHHVMAFCRGYIGESATMASECAVLGVPAVYAAQTARGYTDEQEEKFGLVRNVSRLQPETMDAAINWIMEKHPREWVRARQNLLEETIDVAEFVAEAIESGSAGGR